MLAISFASIFGFRLLMRPLLDKWSSKPKLTRRRRRRIRWRSWYAVSALHFYKMLLSGAFIYTLFFGFVIAVLLPQVRWWCVLLPQIFYISKSFKVRSFIPPYPMPFCIQLFALSNIFFLVQLYPEFDRLKMSAQYKVCLFLDNCVYVGEKLGTVWLRGKK